MARRSHNMDACHLFVALFFWSNLRKNCPVLKSYQTQQNPTWFNSRSTCLGNVNREFSRKLINCKPECHLLSLHAFDSRMQQVSIELSSRSGSVPIPVDQRPSGSVLVSLPANTIASTSPSLSSSLVAGASVRVPVSVALPSTSPGSRTISSTAQCSTVQ